MTDQPGVQKKLPVVDKTKCIGCGTCTVIAEKSFKLGEDSRAEAIYKKDDQGKIVGYEGEEKNVQEAIDCCAVQAISWKNLEEVVK